LQRSIASVTVCLLERHFNLWILEHTNWN
jgi:hypothetical protein